MSIPENLLDIYVARKENPVIDHLMNLQSSSDPTIIFDTIEWFIERAIRQLIMNKQHKQNLNEDKITIEIIDMLKCSGVPAQHDTEIGGHTDISISIRDDFLWLGEAKLWKGATYILGGFNQLFTRYSTGIPKQNRGGILIYFYDKNAKSFMEKWKEKLSKEKTVDCGEIDGLNFCSEHQHKSTGLPFYIKHFAIPLFFDPEDR
ncbi:hypothetical protein [Zymomonas mobilis]|uniref:hypothetical protein n=1 Tax=Zymomonas mobilis TaxID=542 RepID=UPI0021C3203C|nr:hypothetical protein [Zymomonas mobilis]MCP9308678.1 hypothetical protein [Zymomonas mobilis]